MLTFMMSLLDGSSKKLKAFARENPELLPVFVIDGSSFSLSARDRYKEVWRSYGEH